MQSFFCVGDGCAPIQIKTRQKYGTLFLPAFTVVNGKAGIFPQVLGIGVLAALCKAIRYAPKNVPIECRICTAEIRQILAEPRAVCYDRNR